MRRRVATSRRTTARTGRAATGLALVLLLAACSADQGATTTAGPPSTTLERTAASPTVGEPGSTTDGGGTTGPQTVDPPASPVPASAAPATDERTVVTRIVDGDTIVVASVGTVRLIGINTPETKDPRTGVQCFGQEASARTAALLPVGTEVGLEYDVERTDRYDRTLAYVHRLDDGLFVNLDLVATGYAEVATYPPNVRYVERFVAAQRTAREAGAGLWSACGGVGETGAPPPAPPPAPLPPPTTAAPTPGAGCHPSYPSLCLPGSPDLDCGDLSARRFPVVPPDPHRFDADGDGIGCES